WSSSANSILDSGPATAAISIMTKPHGNRCATDGFWLRTFPVPFWRGGLPIWLASFLPTWAFEGGWYDRNETGTCKDRTRFASADRESRKLLRHAQCLPRRDAFGNSRGV